LNKPKDSGVTKANAEEMVKNGKESADSEKKLIEQNETIKQAEDAFEKEKCKNKTEETKTKEQKEHKADVKDALNEEVANINGHE
jgi:hypothetical protein